MENPLRPIQLDIAGILRERIPASKEKYVPRFAYSLLARLIHQDELNAMLRAGYPAEGSEFSRRLLEYLNLEVEIEGAENLPAAGSRAVFASNHPLGGLDGIALIAALGERYGDDHITFMVNDLLMNIQPLSKVFLPINKYGSQARTATEQINREYAGDKHIAVFPAGLVSRLQSHSEVSDLKWHKAFAQKALENGRLIVPVRFVALNRGRFYRLARWRKRLKIKANLEQATLPAELCAARGKHFRIIIGKAIDPLHLRREGMTFPQIATKIRSAVYSLCPPEKL